MDIYTPKCDSGGVPPAQLLLQQQIRKQDFSKMGSDILSAVRMVEGKALEQEGKLPYSPAFP